MRMDVSSVSGSVSSNTCQFPAVGTDVGTGVGVAVGCGVGTVAAAVGMGVGASRVAVGVAAGVGTAVGLGRGVAVDSSVGGSGVGSAVGVGAAVGTATVGAAVGVGLVCVGSEEHPRAAKMRRADTMKTSFIRNPLPSKNLATCHSLQVPHKPTEGGTEARPQSRLVQVFPGTVALRSMMESGRSVKPDGPLVDSQERWRELCR